MANATNSNEIWKDIPGYEGLYQASSFGRIRGVDRLKPHKSRKGLWFDMPIKGRILKPSFNHAGYEIVVLSDKRAKRGAKMRKVHRLVCMTFNENPEGKPEVAHNDGSRNNNRPSNLRWATRAENMADVKIHSAIRKQRQSAAEEV